MKTVWYESILKIYLPEARRDASNLAQLREITVEITEVVSEILRRSVTQDVEFHLLLCLGDSFACQSNMPKADIPLRLRAHANNHELHDMPPASTDEYDIHRRLLPGGAEAEGK
jgi:hypothetical protein